jgi:hypothetical protein
LIEHLEEDAEVGLHVEGGEGLWRDWLASLVEELILAVIVFFIVTIVIIQAIG